MTLILRSDARATNNLGGKHGFSGPMDYVAMLDFASNEFFRVESGQRIDMAIDDSVSVMRSSVGVVKNRDGSYTTVGLNKPRISFIDEYGMSGLLIEAPRTNYAASGANGSTVTIPSAATSQLVCLTFDGGDASLAHAQLTLVYEFMTNGRKCKQYSRTAGSIPATLSVSGGASNISVTLGQSGSYPGHFLGYGGSQAVETATLGNAISNLIAGGDFSVIYQAFMNPTGATDERANLSAIAVKSGAPHGGVYVRSSRTKAANGTDYVATAADSAAINSWTNRASIVGTWRDQSVFGVTCSGRGNNVGVISSGQYNKTTGLGAIFGAPTSIHIGGETGMSPANIRLGGIITRCVVYDRMLTDDEAWAVANAWR